MRNGWRRLFKTPRHAVRDLVWLGLGAFVVLVVGLATDLSGGVYFFFVALGAGRGEVGFVLGVVVVALAIFGVRRWREVADAEYQFRMMFENAPIGVFRATPDGRFLMANSALAHMLGYATPQELIAAVTHISEQLNVFPEKRDAYQNALWREGMVRDFENQVYRRDGSTIWVLGNGRAVRDAHHNILYIEGNLQDITARKENEALYRRLVEQSLQGILIMQDGRLVFMNHAFAELVGYSTSELLAMTPEETSFLIHADDRAQIRERIQDRLMGKNVPAHSVFQIVRRDGSTRWLESNASLIEYHGAPAILLLTVDVTERKRAQDKMQENMLQARRWEELNNSIARAGTDLTAILQNLTRTVGGMLSDLCVVGLVMPDGKTAKLMESFHADRARRNELQALHGKLEFPLDDPTWARLLVKGEPLVAAQLAPEDLERLRVPALRAYARTHQFSSYVLVPLRYAGQILGALGIVREGGQKPYTLDDATLLQEFADRAALAVAIAQLIEKLQRELAARVEAEKKYRTLVEQIPAITYTASPVRLGETWYVSPQIHATLGFSPAEWTATPTFWALRLHPEDRSWVLHEAARCRHMQLPFRAEYRLVARDGGVHWIRDEAVWVLDENKRPLYQHGIMVDVTRYKTLEQKYAQSLEHADSERASLRRELASLRETLPPLTQAPVGAGLGSSLARELVNNAVDILMALAADGTILFVNTAIQTQYGYSPGELVGRNFRAFIHPDDLPIVQQHFKRLRDEPDTVLDLQIVRARARNGDWRLTQGIGVNRLDEPEIGAFLFDVRDVTEATRRERQHRDAEIAEHEQHVYADALGDVAALVNRAAAEGEIFDGILDTVARIVPYETASIFMRDGAQLRLTSARGFEKYDLAEWVRTVTFPVDIQKFQRLAEERVPIVIANTENDKAWMRLPETAWIRSHVSVPIRIDTEVVGMLGLDSTKPNFYNAAHGERLIAFANLAAAALRNAELLRTTQQRAQEFRALYETTHDLSAPNETAPLLEIIVSRARELLHVPCGYLFVYNAAEASLVLAVQQGLSLRENSSLRLGEGFVGRVALNQTPLFTNDYSHWEHRTDDFAEQQVYAVMAVPLTYAGTLIGVLGVAEKDPRREFDEQQRSILMLYAGQAGAALETARLLTESRQRAEQLALLYDVGLTLNRVLDERTQLDFLFKISQRALHSDTLAYFRHDAASETMVYEMGVGVSASVETQLRQRTPSVREEQGIVGWIAKHRLPALIPEVNQDPRWEIIDGVERSAVGVPVEHEQELNGVLVAVRFSDSPFTAQDERLLILFANQIAAAMQLARLFRAQRERQHELEILREASLAFASADRAALIKLILQFALRLVPANNAFLFFYENDELEFGGMLWSEDSPFKPESFTPRRNGVTHTVARTGEVMVIDEVNTHPLFASWRWGGSIVGLPLKGGGQVRAVMNVAYEQPHRFTSEELRALELLADQAAVALENARYVAETERQLRDAQLLHRAGEALNRTLALEETLEQLADFFIQALDVQVCTISYVNIERDEIRVIVDRDALPETHIPPGSVFYLSNHPHLGQMLQEKRSLTFRRDEPSLNPVTAENMDAYHWKTLMVAPLLAGAQIIGIVELGDQQRCRNFTPEQVRLAESLAHQAASALENARLFQETQRRAEELAVLNRIARRVNAAATLEEMLVSIESETARVLPSDASYIALYDASKEEFDFRRVMDYGELRPTFRIPARPSFTREIVTTARALRIDDYTEYPLPENPPQFYGDASLLHSWLGVPIRSGDRVLGVISLQSKQRAAFSEAQEQLLQTIADQVAAAMERVLRGDE